MSSGEILTRLTIWTAILAYVAGTAVFALSGKRRKWDAAARKFWTFACAFLLAHVLVAFQVFHGWSHTAAYRDTALQTNEVVGVNWGGGLYINYLLMVGWLVDVIWWWLSGVDSYRRRPWPLVAAWHGFLVFIIFNATVVFKSGWVRWAGLVVSLSLCLLWLLIARDHSARSGTSGAPAALADS